MAASEVGLMIVEDSAEGTVVHLGTCASFHVAAVAHMSIVGAVSMEALVWVTVTVVHLMVVTEAEEGLVGLPEGLEVAA